MKLYKYKPINNFTLKMLEDSELYFPFPKEFNDPFDCSSNISYAGKKEQHIEFMKSDGKSENEINKYLNILEECDYDPTDKIDKYKSFQTNDYLDTQMVYSLSSVSDNTLMWSHYTNSHQGICIGFEVKEVVDILFFEFDEQVNKIAPPEDKLGLIWKVTYNNDMPAAVSRFEPNQDYFSFFITKHTNWSYENEYRMILLYEDYQKKIYKFRKDILKEVVFGMRISEENKKLVKEIIDKKYISMGFDVDYYQARPRKGTYLLDLIKE